MIPVMGSCLTGASATSQAFLSLSVSVSSVVGGARTAVLGDTCFYELLSRAYGSRHREDALCFLRMLL
jgi:hypothetical protein